MRWGSASRATGTRTCSPGARSPGSAAPATASRSPRAGPTATRWSAAPAGGARGDRNTVWAGGAVMEVLSPTSLEEALRVKAEHPEAVPIQGGTDVMVELNFDRRRPEVLLNLNEVPELRGWSLENGRLRLASGLTYAEAMQGEVAEALPALAEASRTVGSPQIRARGTLGGNLG